MKKLKVGIGDLRPLILGLLVGVLGTAFFLSERDEQPEVKQRVTHQNNWPPREFHSWSNWHYVKVDESGWTTGPVGSFKDLDDRFKQLNKSGKEIVIPIFPTVYAPDNYDKLYYNAILESDIKPGDKVLVIGTGSGSDSWVAWLKSQSPIYVVEANPMAVVNARVTARLADFPIKPIVGDIREVELPADYSNFDYVLWNMPFYLGADMMEEKTFHDGDDGSILRKLLDLLPSLLKENGKAILLNNDKALEHINVLNMTTKVEEDLIVYVITNTK